MFALRLLALVLFLSTAGLLPAQVGYASGTASAPVTYESQWRAALGARAGDDFALWDIDRWRSAVNALYAQRKYAPLWFAGNKATDSTTSLLRELDTVNLRGLEPVDYDSGHLRLLVSMAEQVPDAGRLARADVAISVTAARLASDLQRGRIAAARVGYELDLQPSTLDVGKLILELAKAKNVPAQLDAFEPQMRHYALLKRSLARYRTLAAHPELTALPPLPKKSSLKKGEAYAGAPALRRLLVALGDLADNPEASTASTTLDAPLVAALTRFQTRMGLDADGALGRGTYRALTTPLTRRVQQIELSLERVRWLPRTLQTPPVIVNIPQFRLFAFRTPQDFAQDILQMDVIVGSTFEGRETPVFAADMRYVVLNPYWDVPYSIMTKEFLPEIEADPKWVEQNGYEIVQGPSDDASPVPVTDQNVELLAQGKLRLRQVPGPKNALGRVKFMFPNRHNVYLHDTPARALFKQSRRTFSHGCIRVSDPMALLAHVLRNDPTWTPERIEEALAGPPAMRIPLSHPIPVFILYGTAMATEAGATLFFDDIYSQDAKLARLIAMRRAQTLAEARTHG